MNITKSFTNNKSDKYFFILIVILVFFMMAATSGKYGISWDEGIYLSAAAVHGKWVRYLKKELSDGNYKKMLSGEARDRYWYFTHEHPPLFIDIYGLAVWMTGGKLGYHVPARCAAWLAFALLAGIVFLLARRIFSTGYSLLSVLTFVMLPRVFAHGHFAALDIPAVFVGYLFVYLYITLDWKKRINNYVLLLVFGAALATKISALIPAGVVLIWSLFQEKPDGYLRKNLFIVLGGFLVMIILWPWLWNDPVVRIKNYFTFFLNHIQIPTFYLGHFYKNGLFTPWHYPLLHIAVTTPVVVLFTSLFAMIYYFLLYEKEKRLFLYILLVLIPVLLQIRPDAPHYDGVRLLLSIFPAMAILSIAGLRKLIEFMLNIMRIWHFHPFGDDQKNEIKKLVSLVIILFTGWIAVQWLLYYSNGLSYFNFPVGGIRGAREIGLEYTYWFEPFNRDVIEYINKTAPKNKTIWISPLISENVFLVYKLEHTFRPDLSIRARNYPPVGSDGWRVVYNRLGLLSKKTAVFKLSNKPDKVFRCRGVPLIEIFHKGEFN